VEECCSVCTDFSLMGTDAVCSRECASLALHGCAKTFCQGHDKEWGEKEHPGFFPPTHPVTYWGTPPKPPPEGEALWTPAEQRSFSYRQWRGVHERLS